MTSIIMGAVDCIMTYDGLIRGDLSVKDEGRSQLLQVTANEMQGMLKPFKKGLEKIRTDRNLNYGGITAKTMDLYNAFDADLDAISETKLVSNQAKRADFIKQRTGNLFPQLMGDKVPGSVELRAMMYRTLVETGGQTKIDMLLRTAAADGDPVSIAAIIDAPAGYALCNDRQISEAQEVYRGVLFPAEVAEEREIRSMISLIKFNAASARHAAQKLTKLGDLAFQR